jgi:hypothetical protein
VAIVGATSDLVAVIDDRLDLISLEAMDEMFGRAYTNPEDSPSFKANEKTLGGVMGARRR